MVDRGKCHFVIKAQNVENFGGLMMVVIDNKKNENIDHIVMADDGKGSSVHIPSFLIGYKDGQAIIKATRQVLGNGSGQNKVIIQAKLEYSSTVKNGPVDLDFWYSSVYEIALNDIELENF